MLLLRAALLGLLVCFHVIGGAALFRRYFPRESPWLAFIIPILAVMAGFNFLEHYIALPYLGALLPFTLGGLLWSMVRPGYSWDGLRLPATIFVVVFAYALVLKCLNPAITCNTEGVADMARVLDFCLGDKLPPTDSWCPPYDHGEYYTFQHYGASILTRLFSLDIGTGYNIGFALLNTLTCLVGAGAAFHVSGRKTWVALATLWVLLANFTGSALFLLIRNFPHDPDFRLSIDIGESWNDPVRNPFWWILVNHPDHAVLRLFTPTFNLYFPEFHANLGGHFMTLATLLAAHEAFRTERSNWPWICLLLFPAITILTSTWFFIIVLSFCVGGLAVCLACSRRPENWRFVAFGSALALGLLWPSLNSLVSGSYPLPFFWTWQTPQYFTPFWTWVFQWWPVYIPWLFLLFVWKQLSPMVRWLHAAIPLLLIFVEIAIFGDRGLTVEKMWGALYGAGLVTFLPAIFVRTGPLFRILTFSMLFISTLFVVTWGQLKYEEADWGSSFLHLQGDTEFIYDAQKARLLQELKRLHAATILPGRSVWAYNQAPSIVNLSENRCYIAWFYQEYQCGHAGEAEYRNKADNDFYDGTMGDPLAFLRNNNIGGVLIWPEDKISDAILAQLQNKIGADYFYVDCKADGKNNAGLFIRNPHDGKAAAPPGN